MDNQKLVNKIEELLEMIKKERKERKGTNEEISWVNLEAQLEEYKENLHDILLKKMINEICEYEYKSKLKGVIVSFYDVDCQEIIKIIVDYACNKRKDGIKLSSGAIVSMFNFAIRLYVHGYTLNDIDFLLGEMLGALLND